MVVGSARSKFGTVLSHAVGQSDGLWECVKVFPNTARFSCALRCILVGWCCCGCGWCPSRFFAIHAKLRSLALCFNSDAGNISSASHSRTGRVVHELSSLSSRRQRKNKVVAQKTSESGFSLNDKKEQILSEVIEPRFRNTGSKPILRGEVSRN